MLNISLTHCVFFCSRHCILRAFEKPPSALILYAAHDGQPLSTLADAVQREKREDRKQRRQSGLFSVQDPHSGGVLLKFPQVSASSFTCRIISEFSFLLGGSSCHHRHHFFFTDRDQFRSISAPPRQIRCCDPLSSARTHLLPSGSSNRCRAGMER